MKKIDVVAVKAAVRRGELMADVKDGLIRLTDLSSGERVVIGETDS